MNPPASFSLAKALRDVERFKPLTEQEHDELVALLHAWVERVTGRRDLARFAREGEIGPRRSIEIVHED